MSGYIPGEQPKDGIYIKLNTNENPYPPSPKILNAIKEAVLEIEKDVPQLIGKRLESLLVERRVV